MLFLVAKMGPMPCPTGERNLRGASRGRCDLDLVLAVPENLVYPVIDKCLLDVPDRLLIVPMGLYEAAACLQESHTSWLDASSIGFLVLT